MTAWTLSFWLLKRLPPEPPIEAFFVRYIRYASATEKTALPPSLLMTPPFRNVRNPGWTCISFQSNAPPTACARARPRPPDDAKPRKPLVVPLLEPSAFEHTRNPGLSVPARSVHASAGACVALYALRTTGTALRTAPAWLRRRYIVAALSLQRSLAPSDPECVYPAISEDAQKRPVPLRPKKSRAARLERTPPHTTHFQRCTRFTARHTGGWGETFPVY